MVKPSLRTKSIGTKASGVGVRATGASGANGRQDIGRVVPRSDVSSANGRPPKATEAGGDGHALMAELVALRAILLDVLFKQAKGEPVTAEEMQRLIDRADSDKLRKAKERLEQEL
jgi:hypothetical protein